MLVVLAMAAGLWGIGIAMRAPAQARLLMIGILFVAVTMLHVVLPFGHPLRAATGGTAAPWIMIIVAAVGIAGYRSLLMRLRARAQVQEAERANEGPKPSFAEAELRRYARHIVLREVGGPGQKALKNASVLVIGAGGLGAPVLQYLGAAGIGTLGVIDDDVVDSSNLHRQVIHRDDTIGMPKVFSAQAALEAQNPFVVVKPYQRRLTAKIADALFAEYDLIIDGSDNFDTRYLVNAAAVRARKPLVSGALTQWEGQVSVFDPQHEAPCYACVFPDAPDPALAPPCSEAGVIGPLPGIVGSMMALEAIKVISGAGTPLRGEMLIFDGLYGETRKVAMKRRADCAVCGARATAAQ